jgi:hypothetical protein
VSSSGFLLATGYTIHIFSLLLKYQFYFILFLCSTQGFVHARQVLQHWATHSARVAQPGLEFVILLPLPPKCWNRRCVTPCLTWNVHFYFLVVLGFELKASLLLGKHSVACFLKLNSKYVILVTLGIFKCAVRITWIRITHSSLKCRFLEHLSPHNQNPDWRPC